METGDPSTRAVNSGSGNRALVYQLYNWCNYLDVIPGAAAVHFEVEVSDSESDSFTRMNRDRPDADAVVRVRVRIVRRHHYTSVCRERLAACWNIIMYLHCSGMACKLNEKVLGVCKLPARIQCWHPAYNRKTSNASGLEYKLESIMF